MSSSSIGFSVDSIKVLDGVGVVSATPSTTPTFDRLVGASGITVVVPRGRPQKQTGRFLFTTSSSSSLPSVVGAKRSREEEEGGEESGAPAHGGDEEEREKRGVCSTISLGDVIGVEGGGATSGTMVKVPADLCQFLKDGGGSGDVVVSLPTYNGIIRRRYHSGTVGQALNRELARTQGVRSISSALDASVVTSFVPGSDLCAKLEDSLVAEALKAGGGGGSDAAAVETQRSAAKVYVQRVFSFAQGGATSKKKVTISAPTGLFPALVFECLSSSSSLEGSSNNENNNASFDPIIPFPSGRGLRDPAATTTSSSSFSNSIMLRLVPYYHDLLNRALVLFGTGENVRTASEVCARAASHHLCTIVDSMYPEVQAKIESASSSSSSSPTPVPSVVVTFHNASGEPHSSYTAEGVRYVVLVVNGRRHELTLKSYTKLRYLYQINSSTTTSAGSVSVGTDDVFIADDAFHTRLFILLERYFQLLGSSDNFRQEGGWHAAIPTQVLKEMHARIGVDCEGFSNPFNASSTQFCSAFPDSDCWFGSCGSFFDLEFVSGAVEVNPPFDHSVAMRTAERINALLLQAATTATTTRHQLRFIVVVPTGDSTKKKDTTTIAASSSPTVVSCNGSGASSDTKVGGGGGGGQQQQLGKDLSSAVDFVGVLAGGGYQAGAMSYDGLTSPFRDGCEMAADNLGFVSRFSPLLSYLRSDASLEVARVEAQEALGAIQVVWSNLLPPLAGGSTNAKV